MDHSRGAYAARASSAVRGETAHEYIREKLKRMTEEEVCAAFMVHLDNAAQIRAKCGSGAEEDAERRTGQILSSMFPATDIVSRIGRDEYFIFATWNMPEQESAKKAEEICRRIKTSGNGTGVELTACVGVYITGNYELTFEGLFGYAAAALYEAKNKGRGSWYLLTNEAEDRRKTEARMSHSAGVVTMNSFLECLDGGMCLIESGKELKIIYASKGFYDILGMAEDSFNLPRVICETGIHPDYAADYEQVLRNAAESEKSFEHIHRISANGRDWKWRHVKVVKVPYPASEAPVLLEVSRDISDSVETEQRLCESNERLRIAFKQLPNVLWEVDICSRTYNIYNTENQMCMPETEIAGFPDALTERGLVHPDSAESFRTFARGMLNGKDADAGNFIMRDASNTCYGWVSMSYCMMYDRTGNAVKAVGVQTKLPAMSGIMPAAFPRRPLPEVVRHHLLARMKVNLSTDCVDELWAEEIDYTEWLWEKRYSEIISQKSIQMFKEVESHMFEQRFSPEQLLRSFAGGERWFTEEYRRVDRGGSIRWTSAFVNLLEDAGTQEVYMYACFVDTQQRHEWESRIRAGIFRDPVTGLYDFATAKRLSEYLLESMESSECGVSMISMIKGESWEDVSWADEEKWRARRKSVAVALALSLGEDCVISQYRQDIFYVFFPRVENRYDLKRRIEDALAYTRVTLGDSAWMEELRFVAGTVTEKNETADCSVMAFRGAYLCEIWQSSAMDTAVFPSEDEDWAWAALRKESVEKAVPLDEEKDRPLTKEEQQVAFQCVTAMLKAGSLDNSMKSVLRCIGRYYKASRTYTLSFSEDRQSVTMKHEWVDSGKHSIRYMLSDVRLDQIPLVEKCLEERRIVFIQSPLQTPHMLRGNEIWNFMVYPLRKQAEITGVLCIENAQEHQAQAVLLSTLLPYIMGEPKRFEMLADKKNVSGQDSLTMLPNLTSYMDVIYSLDSDAYSSMGVVSVDVPNFSVLAANFGFEYGRRLLIYISDTLVSIFGKGFIFRTWDAEFVVLFPNTIREVFAGRCNRLRTVLQRRYPHQVRLGWVWSGDVFSARNLVREAQEIMRSEDVEVQEKTKDTDEDGLSSIRKEFSLQKFIPYFQPKIDMRDGTVVGAEVLSRGVDTDGKIIPPSHFIDSLEQAGKIRELDLYMLDAALKQLSKWKKKGLPPIKVSINISRITLFNPTALASVLAIQSRYPEIPADQIELEITETASDMEKATLAGIVDSFRECGVKFALDDFGSGYANISVFSNIRFHTIKLDRSIVNDLPENEITEMLVRNITQICNNFNMNCIAEGVETRQQAEALLEAGCIYGQGYYYARPLPLEEFEDRFLKRKMEERKNVLKEVF